jgi:hypothetical protein
MLPKGIARLAWLAYRHPLRVCLLLLIVLLGLLVAAPAPVMRTAGLELLGGSQVRHYTFAIAVEGHGLRPFSQPAGRALTATVQQALIRTPGLTDGDLWGPLNAPGPRSGESEAGPARFMSDDGAAALFVIVCRGEAARDHVLDSLRAARSLAGADFALTVASPFFAQQELGRSAMADLRQCLPGVLLAMALMLYLIFGQAAVALVCLAEAGFSIVLACAIALCMGVAIYVTTLVAPVLVLTLGVSDDIYFLSTQYCFGDRSIAGARAVYRAALRAALPIGTSALCLCAGLAIVGMTDVAAFRSFAWFGIVSVVVSFILTFLLLPAALAMLPAAAHQRAASRVRQGRATGRRMVRQLCQAGWRARLALVLLFLAAATGLSQLRISDSWLSVLAADSATIADTEKLGRLFHADAFLRLDMVYRDAPALSPAQFADLAEARALLSRLPRMVRTIGADTVAQALLHSMDSGALSQRADYAALGARLIRGVAGGDRLRGLYARDGNEVRLSILMFASGLESRDVQTIVDAVAAWERRRPDPSRRLELTSELFDQARAIRHIIREQIGSMGMSLLALGLISLAALGWRWRSALGVVAGCAGCVFALYGVCGWLGWSLGISTALFGTLVIALGNGFALYAMPAPASTAVSSMAEAVIPCALVVALGLIPMALGQTRPMAHLAGMVACGTLFSALFALVFFPRRAVV